MRWKTMSIGIAAACLAIAPAAQANNYTVTGTAEYGGTCSLGECTTIRAALSAVAAAPDPAGDFIALRRGTYVLTSPLEIDHAVNLRGETAPNTVLTTNADVRILDITANASISHLTVYGGKAPDSSGGNIRTQNVTTTFDRVRVVNGNATTGGGIANRAGNMTIINSLIYGNNASVVVGGSGGGIANLGDAFGASTLTLTNTTVTGNAAYLAGGIATDGDALNSLSLKNVTVAHNQASAGVGGVYTGTGRTEIGSSILANNTIIGTGETWNCGGSRAASLNWNVETSEQCLDIPQSEDRYVVADAGVGTGLENHGGETDVLPLAYDSPAVNIQAPGSCLPLDQREAVRPQGPACDAGAFELDYSIRIDSGPSGSINETTATFGFSSSIASAQLECALDRPDTGAGTFSACTSPVTYSNLPRGLYTFAVKELSTGDVVTRDFFVASIASTPPITITSGPNGPIQGPAATFGFTSSGPAECRLFRPNVTDPAYFECNATYTADDLVEEGAYKFEVTPAGTHEPQLTATREFSVDHTPPTLEITSVLRTGTSVVIEFVSDDPNATFECTHTQPPEVGGSETIGCSSAWDLRDLAEGNHGISLVAVDAAGNKSAPVSRTITIDVTQPPPPVITTPANDGEVIGATSFTFSGTATDATTVEISENGTAIVTLNVADNTWGTEFPPASEGPHTYSVVAIDGVGNRSDPATRTFTVDTTAPTVTITPASIRTNATSATLAFTTSETVQGFTCRVTPPGGEPQLVDVCNSPFTVATPDVGEYRFEVSATDLGGNTSDFVTARIVIDRTAPAPVEASQVDTSTFTFAPNEQDGSFECLLEGPGQTGSYTPCTSPQTYDGLDAGDYVFSLRAVDAAGNRAAPTSRPFSIVAPAPPPAATPTPAASATPTPAVTPAPTPQSGETVVVRPAGGTILVRRPGSDQFEVLDATKGIPLGSEVDARKGKVVLTSEPGEGKPAQRATFYDGLFTIQQVGVYIELTLSEELAPCAKKKKAGAAAKKAKTRKLWGDGKGKFRTRGQYSAATVRGTRWLVQDSCDGTLTRVTQGLVSVRDNVRKKSFLVRAGKRYLAKPKR